MDWHLTWQDPWAIALAVLGLGLALLLRRALDKPTGCSQCATTSRDAPTAVVRPTSTMRIAQNRTDQAYPENPQASSKH